MIVLIEAEQGKIVSDVSFAGYMGAKAYKGKEELNIKLVSINGLTVLLMGEEFKVGEVIVPIGSVDFIFKVSEMIGVKPPKPLNIPVVLIPFLGRKVWIQRKSEMTEFPCFIKPLEEVKRFTGLVVNSKQELDEHPDLKDWDGLVFCSELLSDIISEWRCYISQGKVFNCSCYRGDSLQFPDREIIEDLVSRYSNAPVGYSLDIAVTKDGTELIECNDAWALGYYGGEFDNYFIMVKDRWLEIVSQQ